MSEAILRLMFSVTPSVRFHRILKRMDRVQTTDPLSVIEQSYLALLEGDEILGVYVGDVRSDDIAFSDRAFVFTEYPGGAVVRIPYQRLQSVEYPLPASDSVDLRIQLTDLSFITVRVVGRVDNFRDVFEMGRFFMRVAEDDGKGERLLARSLALMALVFALGFGVLLPDATAYSILSRTREEMLASANEVVIGVVEKRESIRAQGSDCGFRYRLRVTSVIKGSGGLTTIDFGFRGGLEPGQRYVLFFNPIPDAKALVSDIGSAIGNEREAERFVETCKRELPPRHWFEAELISDGN